MDGGLLPRFSSALLLALVMIVRSAVLTSAAEGDGALRRAMLEDAELHDVAFVDSTHGWAVGDRGAIWKTDNGGQSWTLSPSGVGCTLRSVHFNDPDNGWAAGGETRPYVRANKGVLLRTYDGGRTWEADKGILLATVRAVKFFGPQGWALTEPSPLFPSGVLYTDNEGRSWTPLADREPADWSVAAFFDPQGAALAGARGVRAAVNGRLINSWQQTEYGLREPRAMCLASAQKGWLAGDGGLVLASRDGGQSWERALQDPPGAEQFDFRAVDVRDSHIWIAGTPGTRIMHSPDGGTTWEAQTTGQALPINRLKFTDEQHGWAVGALGTILVTIDGGRTWQRQHGARERAALMAVYSDADRVPLEALVRLTANEGYVTSVELLARRDAEPDTPSAALRADSDRAAFLALGASATEHPWGFPLRQQGVHTAVEQLVDGWNRMYAGQGVERLEEYLVRQFRTWRPDVVLTSAASPAGEDPLGHLVNQVVLRAIADAGSNEKFHELAAAGLAPWTVKKVAGSLPPGKLGTLNVNTSQLAPRLTRSLADYAGSARGLLADHYSAPPNAWGFRLYVDNISQGLGQQDFFSGLSLAPGCDARREIPSLGRAGMDTMRQIAEKHRNLQAILAHSQRSDHAGAALLGQIGDLIRGLDPETAGQTLFELAQTYRHDGHWDHAASTFQLLTEKFPNHALCVPALAWLVQYYSSGEALARMKPANESPLKPVARAAGGVRSIGDTVPPANQALPGGIQQAGYGEASPSVNHLARRATRAVEYGKSLEQIDAQAWSDFHVQFPLAKSRQRAATAGADLDRFYGTIAKTRPHDAWWACARGEQWLLDGNGEAPKVAAVVRKAAAKPRLDGDLTDDVWQQAERLELASPLADDAEWPGTVMLAYDDEFLYIAIDCRCAPAARYSTDTRTRERDTDLSSHDRVELRLDVDRDWTTFFRLVVDHRGWTAEDCWGDMSWNPRWFVARAGGEENWTIEAALPSNQLSHEPVGPKTVWALGLQRIVPGVGFQSWTRPATVAGTSQGGGYFIFE